MASLCLASALLGKLPHQRLLGLAIAGYLGGIFAMTFFGNWRAGWFDSGNPMLTPILPTLVWVLMPKSALIASPQGSPAPLRREAFDEGGPEELRRASTAFRVDPGALTPGALKERLYSDE